MISDHVRYAWDKRHPFMSSRKEVVAQWYAMQGVNLPTPIRRSRRALSDIVTVQERKKWRRRSREVKTCLLWSRARKRDFIPPPAPEEEEEPAFVMPERDRTTVIMDEVCAHFRMTMAQLASRKRKRDLVRARHVFCYLIHKWVDVGTTTYIGKKLNRDHSTVVHALKCVETQTETYSAHIEAIEQRLPLRWLLKTGAA